MTKSEFKSGAMFLGAGIAAGGFNYLFQVVAGRNLSLADFAQLNGWFANLALLFAFGGMLQYAGNFWPAQKSTLRVGIVALNAFTIVAIWYWCSRPGILTMDRAAILLLLSTMFGWLNSQVQIRMAFVVLSVSGFIVALTKFGLTLAPIGSPDQLDRYALSLFAAYLPGLWIISAYLWNARPPGRPAGKPHWLSPILISAAAAIFPQFDIALMSHTQMPDQFARFVQASVFFRATYFLIFIFSQWMLPRQIQGTSGLLHVYIPKAVAASLVLSGLIAGITPFLSTVLMNWTEIPTFELVFLSSVQVSLMALLLLQIQEACSQGRNKISVIILAIIGLEALGQLILCLETELYLCAVVAINATMLATIWFLGKRPTSSQT